MNKKVQNAKSVKNAKLDVISSLRKDISKLTKDYPVDNLEAMVMYHNFKVMLDNAEAAALNLYIDTLENEIE